MIGSSTKQPLSLEAGVQFENLTKENEELKYKIGILERENRNLKKSVFQLSHTASQQAAQLANLMRHGGFSERFDVEAAPSSGSTDGYSSGVAGRDMLGDGVDAVPDVSSLGVSKSSKPMVESRNGTREQVSDNFRPSLYCEAELKGHQGAIYTVEWSPHGQLLASGSFDKTVRLWKTVLPSTQNPGEIACQTGHTQLISSLAWSSDSTTLVSGSFDHTVRTWDVTRFGASAGQEEVPRHTGSRGSSGSSSSGEVDDYQSKEAGDIASMNSQPGSRTRSSTDPTTMWTANGFVQAVCTAKSATGGIGDIYCGTSKGFIHHFDARECSNKSTKQWVNVNRAIVNSVQVSSNGQTLVTGDASGFIRVWDLRSPSKPIQTCAVQNDSDSRPITHVTFSQPLTSGSSSQRISVAVNSYDNLLRVYNWSDLFTDANANSRVKVFKGHQNKHWPIKSSFYFDKRNRKDSTSENSSLMLLACGSATSSCYVYDVHNGGMYQKLTGHKGKVYACAFRPIPITSDSGAQKVSVLGTIREDPLDSDVCLATCSSDSIVRLWCPQITDDDSG